jgi:hypothetical protein
MRRPRYALLVYHFKQRFRHYPGFTESTARLHGAVGCGVEVLRFHSLLGVSYPLSF